ncbi:MAG: ABC transporter permease subunit [candidate division Zixibacteria bacterium]|nr:ABC transporter permease subunit [candidate division Zixibacteria bacterium]MDH3937280.1 ABC transporter permease subunit [candidate division Zixibacteria bacterium]MDH4033338.1 ABC transporter permease subunit [candidate division Zixibacteria bacterium]
MTALYHTVLADFRERTRRYSFLVVLGLNLYLGYLVYVGKFTARLGNYRGVGNSAWVGSTMTMTCTLLLMMFGFYVIKNAIDRDRTTGVGEILATTPLTRIGYLFGKLLSNFAVLTSMLMIVAASGAVMQLVDPGSGSFDLWHLLAPFVYIGLPTMLLTAAFAILFESIRWLRGGLGNAVYLIMITMSLPLAMETKRPIFDFVGLNLFETSMKTAALAQFPGAKLNFNLNPEFFPGLEQFQWDGIEWTWAVVQPHFFCVGLAFFITMLAVPFFDRFDPSKTKRRVKKTPVDSNNGMVRSLAETTPYHLSHLAAVRSVFSPVALLLAELRVMLKGFHWSWYVVQLGLIVASLAAPFEIARTYILPVAWVWPLLVWSKMGTRELRWNTSQIMVSCPYPVSRQLPVAWLAGITVALVAGGGIAIKALILGQFSYLAAWLTAALFIPTLAMTLGKVSGTNKLFEVVYMTLWYVGPMNHIVPLDFLAASPEAITTGVPLYYAGATALLIPIMFAAGRHRMGT